MKKITFMLFAFLSMITIGFAQTETLAEWTPVTVTAADSFGQSPFTASTTADNLVVGGLTRGSGIGTTAGTPAANAWGGNDFTATSAVESIDENEFVTFAITADAGYTFSIESIEPYNIRRSNAGPNTGQWQYQLDGGTFVNIGSEITWGGTTSNAGNNQPSIDLSGIADLQDIDAGTTVTFRILLWGATGTGGTWYLNGHNNATNPTLTILGTVEEESSSVPIIYCEINSDYYDVEEITSVVFGDDTTITNTNDTDILVDFTSTIADVEQGETYTITVKGYTGGDYDNEYVAFIDWNQNGILDDAGEVYYIGLIYDSTGYDNKTAFTDINVPSTAITGETRIRITKTYTDEFYEVSLNIDPCYISTYEVGWGLDGSYGQALDFTINVLANDPCADVLAPTGAATQEVALNATLADLDVTGTDLTWYSDATLTTEVAETFVFDQVGEFTYYVTQTVGECTSEALAITVTVIDNTDPCADVLAPIGDAAQEVELNDTLADLDVTGTDLTWYSDATLTTEVAETLVFDQVGEFTYYVTQTVGDCTSDALAITVTVVDPCDNLVVPVFSPVNPICQGGFLLALPTTSTNGITGTWSPALNNMETTTYEFTPNAGQCAASVSMTIVVNTVAPPTADSPQTMTEGQMVSDIVVTDVTGTLTWYSDEDLTTEVEDTFVLTEGTHTFWVTQTIGDCTSEATQVEVEVTLSTDTFDNTSFRTYPNPVRDFFNISYSNDITNVAVINMLGQTIIVKTVNATDTQIDMSGLPTGTYFVKVNIDGLIKTIKVAKQ